MRCAWFLVGLQLLGLVAEHLAELVGGTRPSVNQVLQRLAGDGVVELGRGRGRITIHDRARLGGRSR